MASGFFAALRPALTGPDSPSDRRDDGKHKRRRRRRRHRSDSRTSST